VARLTFASDHPENSNKVFSVVVIFLKRVEWGYLNVDSEPTIDRGKKVGSGGPL
jgi:hypothetical protein